MDRLDLSARTLNLSNVSHIGGGKTPRSAARRSVLGLPSASRSTRGSVSGRSTQSAMVICRTPYHVVENYGTSLPVMVTEAIAYADRSSAVSVRLSKSGWAWLVCGRRLLVWQYKQDGPSKWASVSQCRELTLPPSDLAHRAELVTVFLSKKALVPSCIAVSPEGAVRYWASVAHEGSWIEENADLQGQECDSLSSITGLGCILATTTSTLCLVSPGVLNGRQTVQCKTLRSSQGWLGGISRRVSSIIWGSMPAAQTSETRLIKVLTTGNGDNAIMLVLAGLTLQKWALSNKDVERLIFEFDMSRLLRDSFLNAFWEQNTNAQDLSIWLLDMQPTETGVLILAAAANLHASAQIFYAAVMVASDNDKAPDTFQMFCPFLKFNGAHQGEDAECEDLNYRFVVYGHSALIYNKKAIVSVPVSMNDPGADIDRLEFSGSAGDSILGGSIYRTTPVFFSRVHGVISVTETDVSPLDVMNASMYSEAPSERVLYTPHVSPAPQMSFSQDTFRDYTFADSGMDDDLPREADCISKLKKAFVLYNRRELTACKEILDSIFPPDGGSRATIDGPLDTVIVQVSKDIINDLPASDPRWSENQSIGQCFGTSNSLQVQQQLQGKQQTLELYINFLKSVGLWNRLTAVTARGVLIATSLALQEHAEKVAAALALRQLHSSHADILDRAIKATLVARNSKTSSSALTHIDLFFREVSRVHEILITLGQWSREIVHSNRSPNDVVAALQEVNHVVLETLQEVADFRRHRKSMFSSESMFSSDMIEYLPWTASYHEEGLRPVLSDLLSRNFQYAVRQCSGDQMAYSNLCVELLNLADLLLEGYSSHLESLKGSEKFDLLVHQYELQRRKIIQPFIDESMTEQAMKLAEKYLDFNTLVQICEATNNQDRLEKYIQKFADEGFSEYLFSWYMKEGKQDRLMNLFSGNMRPIQHQHALVTFLAQHPQLAWLQAVRSGNYVTASTTLYSLAIDQTERLHRKKTMLSLSKLSALAAEEPEHRVRDIVQHVDTQLDLCRYQETLPQCMFEYLNQDLDNMGVLTPAQLIKLYIHDEFKDATAFDFKKAIDLLEYVENVDEREDLRDDIWCQAVLRNDWDKLDLDYPMETCRKLIFFQLFDLLNLSGDLDQVLPVEKLLSCSSLGELLNKTTFKFIIKYFYEHVENTAEN